MRKECFDVASSDSPDGILARTLVESSVRKGLDVGVLGLPVEGGEGAKKGEVERVHSSVALGSVCRSEVHLKPACLQDMNGHSEEEAAAEEEEEEEEEERGGREERKGPSLHAGGRRESREEEAAAAKERGKDNLSQTLWGADLKSKGSSVLRKNNAGALASCTPVREGEGEKLEGDGMGEGGGSRRLLDAVQKETEGGWTEFVCRPLLLCVREEMEECLDFLATDFKKGGERSSMWLQPLTIRDGMSKETEIIHISQTA
uniref:Uncharacterized protein n=1 Tax=Chromera velia CCMP2878 TaxID=1169474 RepID=A0A0G4I967_9ALVE|eukprot:Cvel_12071.t1-p1 / transcript=Cvel_12071.t1 / gene=Cvel_12071 / organism=Chromera_velia_CCMP2878 / gene_product=hypothetical protein / transcript_product=hypothetical protein / location=Cvel_scaffold776:16561-25365(+) / protein_length=259 / sequence_SO=supercontig / SO=protein_coding / is_pseudo=false